MLDATCPVCSSVFTPRAKTAKYCSSRCSREFYNSAAAKRCSEDDCDKPMRARGLCSMHWKRAHGGPRTQVEMPCDMCGVTIYKDADDTRARRYCTYTCRSAHRAQLGDAFQRPRVIVEKPARQLFMTFDQRSSLRYAYETQDWRGVTAAIRADCAVTPTGCWEWQRRLSAEGYAHVRLGKRHMAVHRLAVEAKHGKPLGDQPVHHECANRKCVNPDHLMPVTHRENVAEMLSRNYLVARIRALELALADVAPSHPLLNVIGIEAEAGSSA